MEQNVDVVDLISNLLDSGKYKEVISVLTEEKYADSFKDNCWDLISVVISKIQDDTIIIKPSLHHACEELLSTIVQKTAPEEALLEFLDQIEGAKNDAQFCIILSPLQHLLKKLYTKREVSLEWCLNSISTYIETIPIPEHQLEGKERLLIDCDINIRRITRVYTLLPPFYNTIVKEFNSADSNNKSKQIITAFLISLLGKPLIYIDLEPDSNAESEARQACAAIIHDICTLEKNMFKFLTYLELSYKESQKSKPSTSKDNDKKSPYEHREKVNLTTLSGLFYTVLSGHFEVPEISFPQVYCIEYIVHTVMFSVIHLLNFSEYGPLAKAIALLKPMLNRLPKNISYDLLSSSVHFDLCNHLVNVAIYCGYKSIREEAVNLIGCHILKFEYKGRYILINYLLDTSNHSGMIGYAITLLKNSINEAFSEQQLPDCFTGAKLKNMLKKICFLPHGETSDLIELADQIITALNFLRYLSLKDSKNVTGIRDCFSIIETDYLDKLRTGLNLSKAHYEVKLKDIEGGKDLLEEKFKVTLNIGGNTLDNIPMENKKEIIISALNAFHLIEGLIARLSECININKMQGLNMDSIRNSHRVVAPLASVSLSNTQKLIRNYCQSIPEKDTKVIAITTAQEEYQYEENVKNRILEKALNFVTKHGWSIESLTAGAEAVGYPSITHGLFPNGGGDLVHYFNVKCNERLIEQMKNWPKEDIKGAKVPTKFIENAIMTRLLMIGPYKNTWPKAMAIQTLPNNVSNCLATLLSLVDDICYYSGDRSVDFNWYIRRVGLAGIYKAAELFYLTDNSQDNTATRNFVTSRIRDAQLIQTALNLSPVSAAPQTLSAAFVTAKNILGINTLK